MLRCSSRSLFAMEEGLLVSVVVDGKNDEPRSLKYGLGFRTQIQMIIHAFQ